MMTITRPETSLSSLGDKASLTTWRSSPSNAAAAHETAIVDITLPPGDAWPAGEIPRSIRVTAVRGDASFVK